jgi:hypothetical protein
MVAPSGMRDHAGFPIDSHGIAQLMSAPMTNIAIILVGKRMGKAV